MALLCGVVRAGAVSLGGGRGRGDARPSAAPALEPLAPNAYTVKKE